MDDSFIRAFPPASRRRTPAPSFASIAKALRLTNGYQVTTDHFGARLTATLTETTKTARAVLYRNASTGQTSLIYYRVE